jgi:hypothetical protein
MYKLNRNPLSGEVKSVNKTENGVLLSIPFDPANRDYTEYLEWLSEGNTPEAADE